MNFTEINCLFESFGYPNIIIHEQTIQLSDADLLSESLLDGQSLLSTLSEENHPLVASLCTDRAMADIILNSMIQYDFHVPQHILQACEFERISKKTKKIQKGETKNGLFYFLQKYAHEVPFTIKPIIRRDESHPLLIEAENKQKHLTIDENYAEEKIHGNYFFHYAHISMQKNDVRIRIYFDENLKLVKTSAFIEVDGEKISRLNPRDLDISPNDYQDLFQMLTELNKLHLHKIKSLDLELTPHFMFINNPEKLAHCREAIKEINCLKSPLFDCRQEWLHREVSLTPEPVVSEISYDFSTIQPISATFTKNKASKVKKTKTEIKNERIRNCLRDIELYIQKINELIATSDADNLHINQALDDILNLEFLLIHHAELIHDHRESYERRVHEMKFSCLNHIHDALENQTFTYLDRLYDKSQYFIDSMIVKYMKDLAKKLYNSKSPFESNDKQKLKKCLELMGYFYDKNELYHSFFVSINIPLAYNPSSGQISNLVMRVIELFDVSSFIEFLIDKNYIKPTDCIGVVNHYYISLQQYILLYCLSSHENYSYLLNKLIPHIHTFFDITQIELFEQVMEQDNNRLTSVTARGANQHTSRPLEKAKAIDFIPYIKVNPDPSPLDVICRSFFTCDPVLAFTYLAVFLNCYNVYNMMVPSAEANVLFVSCEKEMKSIVENIVINEIKSAMTHVFYPAADTFETGTIILNIAQDFLNQICQQPYLSEQRNDDKVIMHFMKELNKSSDFVDKSNIITAATIYILKMTWTTETFKKYCYFAFKKLEVMSQKHQFSGIIPTISILNNWVKSFNDELLLTAYQQMLQKTIDKIKHYYPIEHELKRLSNHSFSGSKSA